MSILILMNKHPVNVDPHLTVSKQYIPLKIFRIGSGWAVFLGRKAHGYHFLGSTAGPDS